MIAPLRPPETATRRVSRHLHKARGFVAATFLKQRRPETGPPIPAWKAWSFVAWLVIVTTAFALAIVK